jgi:hypothetical protein
MTFFNGPGFWRNRIMLWELQELCAESLIINQSRWLAGLETSAAKAKIAELPDCVTTPLSSQKSPHSRQGFTGP